MLIPNAKGIVTSIAPKGKYTVIDTVLEIEFEGKKSQHSMMQVCRTVGGPGEEAGVYDQIREMYCRI